MRGRFEEGDDLTTERLTQHKLDVFGGLVTLLDKSDLQYGQAAEATNCEFVPGALRTRRGFGLHKGSFPAGYGRLYSFLRYLPIDTTVGYGKDLFGLQHPLNKASSIWDGTTNGAIMAHNFNTSGVGGSPNYPNVMKYRFAQYGKYVYAARSVGNWALGSPLRIAPTTSYAGSMTVRRMGVASPAMGPTSVADAAAAGSVDAGVHWVLVVFESESGYRSQSVGVPTTFTAAGGKKADVTGIPIGPPGTAKRLLFMTAANTPLTFTSTFPYGDYYCVETTGSGMVIDDNTTTTATINVADLTLLSGTSGNDLLDLQPLPPSIGFTVYRDRMVAYGVRPELSVAGMVGADQPPNRLYFNMMNVQMESTIASAPPLWITTGAGGAHARDTGGWPDSYWKVTGDGATVNRGQVDLKGPGGSNCSVPPQRVLVSFAVRRTAAGTALETLEWNMFGSGWQSLTTDYLAATNQWQQIYAFIYATPDGVVANTAHTLGFRSGGTLANGAELHFADAHIFDATQDQRGVWVSDPFEPEAFSQSRSVLGIDASDGEHVVSAFVLRGNLYLVRERSIFVTQDNGGDPATWQIEQVSSEVGAFGADSVWVGDGYAVIAGPAGVYLFDGGVPQKISDEIRTSWNSVVTDPDLCTNNWVTGSAQEKKVWIGVYTGSNTTAPSVPDTMYVLDFADGWGMTERKWGTWTIPATKSGQYTAFGVYDPSQLRLILPYSAADLASTEAIYWPTTGYTDTGVILTASNIAMQYETAPFPSNSVGQYMWGYLTSNVSGVGNLRLSLIDGAGTVSALTAKTLSAASKHDIEIYLNKIAERFTIRVQNGSTAGDYIKMQRITAFLREAPFQRVRGNG